MSYKRDGYGRGKRSEKNRSIRRAHFIGALRMVNTGKREVTSFKGRMMAALSRFFA